MRSMRLARLLLCMQGILVAQLSPFPIDGDALETEFSRLNAAHAALNGTDLLVATGQWRITHHRNRCSASGSLYVPDYF